VDRSAPTTELYDALAPIYDDWQSSNGMRPFGLATLTKLLPELEREARGAPLSFADVGCGTGTLLDGLAAARPDWRLCGLDASPGMLAMARAKPRAPAIGWLRARLGEPFPFAARPFDAAGSFYDTLNHVPDPGALARALASLAGAVREGGLVVFDLTNRLGFERWWRGCNDFRSASWRLTVDARFDRQAGVGTAQIRIEHAGRARVFPFVERLWSDTVLNRALGAAGLRLERADPWSPFSLDVPGKTWCVARRR
jgi:SAM-dependent methyltransferase